MAGMTDKTQDYERLRGTVTNLLQRIEQNQQIQARFHDFEFQLLACTRFAELVEKLLFGAMSHFEVEATSLVLYDPDYSIAGLLERLNLGDYHQRLQLRHGAEFFSKLYHGSPTVKLGALDEVTRSRLFPGYEEIGSAALLPLMRQNRLIGSLHFASRAKERYSPDKAVSFMWHLASMVAICLENCLTREQLQRQGQEDILTQVRNRRSFEEEFEKELERAERNHEPLSCVFVDIDHFKQINDAYGHQTGDRCLRQVAQLINDQLRKTDLLARYGGEEFVALLPRCHRDEAMLIAERVRLAVSTHPLSLHVNQSLPLTISVGLCTWQPRTERSKDLRELGRALLAQADKAMYAAKAAGRNRVMVADFSAASVSNAVSSDNANTFP